MFELGKERETDTYIRYKSVDINFKLVFKYDLNKYEYRFIFRSLESFKTVKVIKVNMLTFDFEKQNFDQIYIQI